MRTLLASFALAAATLGPGQAFAAPASVAASRPVDRLVALLLPEDSLLQLGARAFDIRVARELAADPVFTRAQARHPGLRSYVLSRLRPTFLKALRKDIPALRRDVRAVVADGLTPAETAEALAFFASPTGAKLSAQLYASMADNPGQSPREMEASVTRAVMAQMKIAEYPALIAFGASPAAAKMKTINPRIAAASQAWSDRLAAKHGKRMHALAATATRRYLKGRQ